VAIIIYSVMLMSLTLTGTIGAQMYQQFLLSRVYRASDTSPITIPSVKKSPDMRLTNLLFLSSPILTLAAPSAERIAELFAPLATGDSASVIHLLSPNITWTVFGGVTGGTYNYTGLIDFLTTVGNAIEGTYKPDLVSVISEGAEGKRYGAEGCRGDGGEERSVIYLPGGDSS